MSLKPVHCAAALAKLNLVLRVGPPRPDGFHAVDTLAIRIQLADEVSIRLRDDPQLTLTCDTPGIPTDDANLAIRAARALRDHARHELQRHPAGVDIGLRKRIPAGAGLGGGSSDAAATLRLLNQHWNLGLDWHALAAIGARLGSDVPLFLAPTALIHGIGRGEQVTPLPQRIAGYATLLLSGVHCATAAVYRMFDELNRAAKNAHAATAGVGSEAQPAGDAAATAETETSAIASVQAGTEARPTLSDTLSADTEILASTCHQWIRNDLEPAAFALAPALPELAARVEAGTGLRPALTGSGSALFRLFDTESDAIAYAARARNAVPGIGAAVARLGD